MNHRLQCGHCLEILGVDARLIGRKIRCPWCESAVTVPAPDTQSVFIDADLREQIEKFRLSDWDRACARKALELDLVPQPALRRALRQRCGEAKMAKTPTLLDLLMADNAIDRRCGVALAELAKGAAPAETRECPNCFAIIPAKSERCRFCGEEVGDLLLYDICPNCKRRQPAGRQWCGHCHADMATGLLPGMHLPRCPRCATAIKGDYALCPKCKTRLDRSRQSIAMERHWRALRVWWARWSLAVLLAATAAIIAYCAMHWVEVKGMVVGRERAILEERVQQFDTALHYDDLATVAKMLAPGLGKNVDQEARTCILGGESGWRVKTVKKIRHPTINLDLARGQATVYTQVEGEYDPATIRMPKMESTADLEKAAHQMGKVRYLASQTPWQWVWKDATWYYAGPLP